MAVIAGYLLLGAFAGTAAGLLGIGGGLLIVPALLALWQGGGLHGPWLVQMAIATSLASIVFTSLASVWAHHRRGAVRWPLVWRLAPGILLGAALGALFASAVGGGVLKRLFGLFELLVAAQMAFTLRPGGRRPLPGGLGLGLAGSVIGGVSALLGIGGGTLTVPFLTWCDVVIQQAVATSAACGLPIALAGSLVYLFAGQGMQALPPGNLGLIHLPALAGIVAASMLFAPLGSRLAHRLSVRALRRVFAAVLALLGLWMLAGG